MARIALRHGAALAGMALVVAAGCERPGDERTGSAGVSPELRAELDRGAELLEGGTPEAMTAAETAFLAVLAQAPGSSEARIGLARAEHALGRPWAAAWQVLRAAHADSTDAGSRSMLGLLIYDLGSAADAIAPLEQLAALRPLSTTEQKVLGDSHARSQQYAAADSLFTLVLARTPEDARVLEQRGWCRREQGMLDEATADLTESLRLDPRNDGARLALADLLLDVDQPARAAEVLDGFTSVPMDSLRYHQLRGRADAKLARYDEALRHLEIVAAVDAYETGAYELIAQVKRRMGDRAGAREAAARHAETMRTTRPPADNRGDMAVQMAARALEAGDDASALDILRTALEATPDHAYLLTMAEPLLRAHQDPAARDALERLRRRAGGSAARLYFETGKILRDLGYLQTAASQLRIAAKRLKGDEQVAFFLAWTLLAQGDDAGAQEAAAILEQPAAAAAATAATAAD